MHNLFLLKLYFFVTCVNQTSWSFYPLIHIEYCQSSWNVTTLHNNCFLWKSVLIHDCILVVLRNCWFCACSLIMYNFLVQFPGHLLAVCLWDMFLFHFNCCLTTWTSFTFSMQVRVWILFPVILICTVSSSGCALSLRWTHAIL